MERLFLKNTLNREKAIHKHKLNKYNNLITLRAYSSVSLPNWNACRLHWYQNKLKAIKVSVAKTDLIIACIKAYLPKCNPGVSQGMQHTRGLGPQRTRKQNEKNKYRYSKVSTYCDTDEWNALQYNGFNIKVSFSHMVDIALRLYLALVVQQLLAAAFQGKSLITLQSFGKYQKQVLYESCRKLKIIHFIDLYEHYPRKLIKRYYDFTDLY